MKPQVFLMFIYVSSGLLLLRLLFLAVTNLPLDCEEAQYWYWSKNFDWGYFSKPPMVSWLISLTTFLGGDTVFAIRASAPILHLGTALMVHLLAQRAMSAQKATYAALIYLTFPGTFFSCFLMTTDVPMLFFSSITLYCMWRSYEDNQLRNWGAAGFFLGLSLLSKYIAIFSLIGFLGFLVLFCRYKITSVRFFFMLGICFVVLFPNLLWQFENDLLTFYHTAHSNIAFHAYGAHFNITKALEYIMGQAILYGPLFFLAFFQKKVWICKKKKSVFYHFFIWPIFLTMIFQALMSKINLNWGVFMSLGAVLLISYQMDLKWLRWIFRTNLCLGFLILVLLVDYETTAKRFGIQYKGHQYHSVLKELESTNKKDFSKNQPHLIVGHRCLASLGSFYGSYESVNKWFLKGFPHDHFEKISPFQINKNYPGCFLIYTGQDETAFKSFFKKIKKVAYIKEKPLLLAEDFIGTETA
jgi:4-amino-4-deoxy-L-arabinose transferase-like glycosyltransferase